MYTIFISYCLIAVEPEASSAPRNASTVLMASRYEKHLPCKITGDNIRGNQKLFNDLLKVLSAKVYSRSP